MTLSASSNLAGEMAEDKDAFGERLYHYAAQVLQVIDGDTLRINLDMGMCIKQTVPAAKDVDLKW